MARTPPHCPRATNSRPPLSNSSTIQWHGRGEIVTTSLLSRQSARHGLLLCCRQCVCGPGMTAVGRGGGYGRATATEDCPRGVGQEKLKAGGGVKLFKGVESFPLSPQLSPGRSEPLLPIASHGVGRGQKVCVRGWGGGGSGQREEKGKSHLVDHAGNEAQLLDVFKGRHWGQTGVGVGGGGGRKPHLRPQPRVSSCCSLQPCLQMPSPETLKCQQCSSQSAEPAASSGRKCAQRWTQAWPLCARPS